MTQAHQKITLSASRDIPFNKLVLSQSNVRRIKAGISIEELAEDIGRRTLLQSLTVRAVVDADGIGTGMFEVPAGGRRYRALDLLVRQKRLAKTAPVPCVIREGGIAEEDSLAENIQRAPLHPLDQFRAFLALRERGQSEQEIAAAFFVSVAVVRQRLRLASVSPKLLDVYAEDGLTLDQLMAFSVNGDHERQEQVFERLGQSYAKEPYAIRRMLTEGAVRACDKRAQFIGVEYEAAGGAIMRDLFQGDDGGWLQDVSLVDRLVAEKLEREAESVRAEGWKWTQVAQDFAYGHTHGLRQLRGEAVALTDEEEATRTALRSELEALEETYAQVEDLPEEVDQRLAEIETALAAFEERPVAFEPEEIARAGAYLSLDGSGALRIERGYVLPEDELPIAAEPASEGGEPAVTLVDGGEDTGHGGSQVATASEEDEEFKPIPERLMTELTAHRTIALRQAMSQSPDIAFLAVLHVLCLKVFYRYAVDSCLELDFKRFSFDAMAPGLNDTPCAKALEETHQAWTAALPKAPGELWDALGAYDADSRQALFAHCAALSVNAVHEAWNRRPSALSHADRLAQILDLDMIAAGWTPTVETYLGRVTKARIVAAVREAKGERAAQAIEPLKKVEMAEKAQDLLSQSGWLPEPLRTPGRPLATASEVTDADAAMASDETVEETAVDGGEPAMAREDVSEDDEVVSHERHSFAAE